MTLYIYKHDIYILFFLNDLNSFLFDLFEKKRENRNINNFNFLFKKNTFIYEKNLKFIFINIYFKKVWSEWTT